MPKDDSLLALPGNMATEWSVRKRRPVRRKHIAPLLKRLEGDLAIDLNVDGAFLEMAEYGPWTMVFVDRTPLVIELRRGERTLRVLDPTRVLGTHGRPQMGGS